MPEKEILPIDSAVHHKLPRHVAFIMDGNGRWAEERGLPRALGHREGAETVRRVVRFARRRGIPYLSLYAFSTENWSRPQEEIDALMELLSAFIDAEMPTMLDNGVRLRIMGDMGGIAEPLREKLARACFDTSNNTGLTLNLGINYGGRDEIVRAARQAARHMIEEGRRAWEFDAETLGRLLDTGDMPDPDLIVRTAGEKRLSNFMIWQAAYSELCFIQRRWPEFSDADFEEALAYFGKRVRTFGGAHREPESPGAL